MASFTRSQTQLMTNDVHCQLKDDYSEIISISDSEEEEAEEEIHNKKTEEEIHNKKEEKIYKNGWKFGKQTIPHTLKRRSWNHWYGDEIGKTKCYCCRLSDITPLFCVSGHIKAEKNGGKLEEKNIIPICASCNSSMNTKHMHEFMETIGINHQQVERELMYERNKRKHELELINEINALKIKNKKLEETIYRMRIPYLMLNKKQKNYRKKNRNEIIHKKRFGFLQF